MFEEMTLRDFMAEVDIMDLGGTWSVMSADAGDVKGSLVVGWRALGTHFNRPVFTIYINENRYSKHVFDQALFFSASFFTGHNRVRNMAALRYLGTTSGRDGDKFEGAGKLGLTLNYAEADGCRIPYYAQADHVILCRKVAQTQEDIELVDKQDSIYQWLQKAGVHHIYDGEVMAVLKNVGK